MLILSYKLTTSEWTTLISSIAAAVSAIFAAVTAWLMWWQNKARYKVKYFNKIKNNGAQNIFNNEHKFAMIRLSIQNLSHDNIYISQCYIKVKEKNYFALEPNTDYKLPPDISLKTEYNANIKLNKNNSGDGFLKFPLKIEPHQYIDKFVLIPGFPPIESQNVKCVLHLDSLVCRNKKKRITIYCQDCI